MDDKRIAHREGSESSCFTRHAKRRRPREHWPAMAWGGVCSTSPISVAITRIPRHRHRADRPAGAGVEDLAQRERSSSSCRPVASWPTAAPMRPAYLPAGPPHGLLVGVARNPERRPCEPRAGHGSRLLPWTINGSQRLTHRLSCNARDAEATAAPSETPAARPERLSAGSVSVRPHPVGERSRYPVWGYLSGMGTPRSGRSDRTAACHRGSTSRRWQHDCLMADGGVRRVGLRFSRQAPTDRDEQLMAR
jgi:hypothetical protein